MTKRYTVTVEVTAPTEKQADHDINRWIVIKSRLFPTELNDSKIVVVPQAAVLEQVYGH